MANSCLLRTPAQMQGLIVSSHRYNPTATSASQYSHQTVPSVAGETVFRGDADVPLDDGASDLYHTMSYYGLATPAGGLGTAATADQGMSTAIQVGTPKSSMAGVFARQQRDLTGVAH